MPREHGAWGILLVPLFAGAAAGVLRGGAGGRVGPLLAVALALFWLRTPVESWVGTVPIRARTAEEVGLVRRTVLLLGAAAGGALVWLFWGGRNGALLWIGGGAAAAFVMQAAVKWRWHGAKTAAQMVGAAGLTATAPAAYYVVTGRLDNAAWALWAANLLFAVNQIHFVQLRIHAARAATGREKRECGRGFLAGQVALMAALGAACRAGVFPWYGALAFLPLLIRGFAWFTAEPAPLAIHALGKRELLYACAFGVLLVVGMGAQ